MKKSKYFYLITLVISFFLSGAFFAQTKQEINLVDHYGGWISQIANNSQNIFIAQSQTFKIADLSNNQLKVKSTTFFPWEIWEMFVDETTAFLSHQNMIIAINFSDINNITTSNMVSLGTSNAETITSIYANSQYVFTTQFNYSTKTGTFRMLNRNDLTELGSVNIVSQQVQVVNNTAYIITGDVSMGISTLKLRAYDVSNPSNITELSSILLGARRMQVVGNYAYVVGYGIFGLAIVDVTNPANMTITSAGKGPKTFYLINILGNYAYASSSNDFYSIDVTNKSNPTQIATFNMGSAQIDEQIIYPNVQQSLRAFLLQGENGEVQILDISTPANIVKLNPYNSPSSVDAIEYYQDNIFIGNGTKIWKSPVNNLQVDNHYLDEENKFIRAKDGVLYIASDNGDNSKLTLYDISDLNNPVKKGEYQTNGNINKFEVFEKYAYLIFQNSTSLDIINCSDPNNPQKISSFQINGNGTEIFIPAPNQNKLVYVGYYNSTTSVNETAIVNVTNTAAPALVSKFPTYGIPYAIYVDSNTLYTGGSSANAGEWFLQVFDITNKQTPAFLTQIITTGVIKEEGYYDMFANNDKLVVTLNNIGIRTYELIRSSSGSILKETSKISLGPSLNQTGEAKIPFSYYLQTYQSGQDLYGYTNGVYPKYKKGSYGLTVFKIPNWPQQPEKVYLTMGILPPEAFENGNTTNPEPGGPYEYNKGEIVLLQAYDNPPKGWHFKEWTVDASGTSPQVLLEMDRSKGVIANFVEVRLTVSGDRPRGAVCVEEFETDKIISMLNINLKASEGDGWYVNSIKIRSKGTGNELNDIKKVNAYLGGTLAYTGNYKTDDGELTLTFSPPISIPPGETVTVNLEYEFGFEATTYLTDNAKSFKVETQGVAATPWTYIPGVIEGNANREELYIARVYNDDDYGFYRIQEAIESNTTKAGDFVFVCEGEYKENLLINKTVILTGLKGAEKTIVDGGTTNDMVVRSDVGAAEINGFTFIGKFITINNVSDDLRFYLNRTLVERIYFSGPADRGSITDNQFYNLTNLIISHGNRLRIENNQFISGNPTMQIETSENNKIVGNSGFYLRIGDPILGGTSHSNLINNNTLTSLTLLNAHENTISSNTISGSEVEGIFLAGSGNNLARENVIENNNISTSGNNGISLMRAYGTKIKNNTIYKNTTNGIVITESKETQIFKNDITDNGGNGILITNADFTSLYDNTIKNHQGKSANGIWIYNSRDSKVYSNQIIKNCTGIYEQISLRTFIGLNNVIDAFCLSTGIRLDSSSPSIIGNTIANNSGDGILTENGSKPVINSNNIFGNTLSGINNTDPVVNINATGNWWGSAAGPDIKSTSGNVNTVNWVNSKIDLFVNTLADTLKSFPGASDSTVGFVQNFNKYDDIVNIQLTDDYGWITSSTNFNVTLKDSIGGSFSIKFSIPNNTSLANINKVKITAQSTTSPNITKKDSFYISLYNSTLTTITVIPDSVVLEPNDTRTFIANSYDQNNAKIAFNPIWEATGGTIDQTGLYTAGNVLGNYKVTARNTDGSVKGEAFVQIAMLTSVEEEKLPTEYVLYQNYPNPFNPVTTIKYSLPNNAFVDLSIYNLLGEKITTLVRKEQSAGSYSVNWNAQNHSSGVYIYVLRTSQKILVNKMVMIK